MDKFELGQIAHRILVRQWMKKSTSENWLEEIQGKESTQIPAKWEEIDDEQKEIYCKVAASIQQAILQEYVDKLISVEKEGIRILGESNQIPSLLKYLDQNLPEYSYERPHILNLASVVKQVCNGYKDSETKALSKIKAFKDDVLIYLRAIALVAETVGNAGTHKEKDIRMRGLIAQIESAIQKVREEEKRFYSQYWYQTPDLFRSDYPVLRYLERIRELENENKKLKNEPSTSEEEGIF